MLTAKDMYLNQVKKAKDEIGFRRTFAKSYFDAGCKQLFEENPDLEKFAWAQGCPSWNDGDRCYFTVRSESPWINGIHFEYDDYKGKDEMSVERFNDLAGIVCTFISSITKNDLESMFGDSRVITVTREAVKIESDYAYYP